MRIVWLGRRESASHRDLAHAIETDSRVASFDAVPLDAPTDAIESRIAGADGVVLAVHHFEPGASRWLARLESSLDPLRWRAALGPFALVAGRAPFEVMHRQGIAAADVRAARRWLRRLADGEESPRTVPGAVLIWAPSEERSGIDPCAFDRRSATDGESSRRAAIITPRTSGLPFAPQAVIAWIPADLNREERVHLGQLAAAARNVVRIAVYASLFARERVAFAADETFVWPYDVAVLQEAAVDLVAARALATSVDRAA